MTFCSIPSNQLLQQLMFTGFMSWSISASSFHSSLLTLISKFRFFWNLRTTHKEIRKPVVIVELRLLALVGWLLIESCQSHCSYHPVDLPPSSWRLKGGMKTSSSRCFGAVHRSPSLSWFDDSSTGQSEENPNCGFRRWCGIEGPVSCIGTEFQVLCHQYIITKGMWTILTL